MQYKGFTLVELVVIIILLGILSVFVAPRLFSSSDFEPYSVRDQLVAMLRQVQTMQMQDAAHCYQLRAEPGQFSIRRGDLRTSDGNCTANIQVIGEWQGHNLAVQLPGQSDPESFSFSFNSQFGRSVHPSQCDGQACQLEIGNSNPLLICINEEGYIRAC